MSYTTGFLRAWKLYPHYQGRAHKAAAFRVWCYKQQPLEELAGQVCRWIEAMKASRQWQDRGGEFIPAMEVWLKRPDFNEDPPAAAPRQAISHKGAATLKAVERVREALLGHQQRHGTIREAPGGPGGRLPAGGDVRGGSRRLLDGARATILRGSPGGNQGSDDDL